MESKTSPRADISEETYSYTRPGCLRQDGTSPEVHVTAFKSKHDPIAFNLI